MDWKIEDIQIRNFKYAHNLFSIHVGQKNMLLYGENGCGKSTIYWALYTLYQSYFKENEAAVAKYFDESNDQNLLNRYDTDASQFLVKVVYKNETDVEKELELSPVNMTVVRSGDTFVQNTATFSDFSITRLYLLSSIFATARRQISSHSWRRNCFLYWIWAINVRVLTGQKPSLPMQLNGGTISERMP